MNKNLSLVLRAAGAAALALLVINLLTFGVQVLRQGAGAEWSFRLKHAVFYLGDVPAGWALGSVQANALMLVVFLYVLFRYYQRGELTLV
jgi:hypothetical protein